MFEGRAERAPRCHYLQQNAGWSLGDGHQALKLHSNDHRAILRRLLNLYSWRALGSFGLGPLLQQVRQAYYDADDLILPDPRPDLRDFR